MTNFRFDGDKGFAQNCETFLDAITADDPEMATILRDNWDALVAVVREGERVSTARNEFHSAVATTLDRFVRTAERKEGS